ncbi:MAG: Smr/MutS family protein [Acidobacteria bacterium]|nr:Smr/MutS family protein [Acidobacteriota bacterium]
MNSNFDYKEDFFEDEVIELPIEDTIDLHSFSPKEIKAVVEEYLYQAHQKHFPVVRIIHGKGIGVQREIVRKILSSSVYVESFSDGGLTGGSWGATVAYLKYQD